jgi:hypothetical protein
MVFVIAVRAATIRCANAGRFCLGIESFELLRKPCKLSFLRKQESNPFKTFWIPAFAGMTK